MEKRNSINAYKEDLSYSEINRDKFKVLPIEESEQLSPIEKYKSFGKFPYLLLFNILLVIFSSIQILIVINSNTNYKRRQERILYKKFLNNEDQETEINRFYYLQSISELKEFIKLSIENYYKFSHNNIEIIKVLKNNPELEFNNIRDSFEGTKIDNINDFKSINLTLNNLGPFSKENEELRSYLKNKDLFTIQYKLRIYIPQNYNSKPKCYDWKINQQYNRMNSMYRVNLDINTSFCKILNRKISFSSVLIYTLENYFWLHLIVIITSFLSLYISINYIYQIAEVYMHSKKKLQEIDDSFSNSDESDYYNPIFSSHSSIFEHNGEHNERNINENNNIKNDNEYDKITNNIEKNPNQNEESQEVIFQRKQSSINKKEIFLNKLNSIRKDGKREKEIDKKISDDKDLNNTNDEIDDFLLVNKLSEETKKNEFDKTQNESLLKNQKFDVIEVLKLQLIKNQSFRNEYNINNIDDEKIKNNEKLLDQNLKMGWTFVCILSSLFLLFGSILSMIDYHDKTVFDEYLVGFGCALAFFNMGRYLEYSHYYDTIYATLGHALPNVLKYIIGVSTLLFAFLFFGVLVFGRSGQYFNSITNSLVTLFAVILGDSIFNVFNDVNGFTVIIGSVYWYLFIIIFIAIVLNIFIVILEESYTYVKVESKDHWLVDYKDKLEETNKVILKENEERFLKNKASYQKLSECFNTVRNNSNFRFMKI